jgi:hypothetical protein
LQTAVERGVQERGPHAIRGAGIPQRSWGTPISTDVALEIVASQLSHLGISVQQLKDALKRFGEPQPQVVVDVQLPPFRTTIDDPAYPDKLTISGQWFD